MLTLVRLLSLCREANTAFFFSSELLMEVKFQSQQKSKSVENSLLVVNTQYRSKMGSMLKAKKIDF